MLVEVRPLPVEKWHGKKNKESFAQTKVYEVAVNPDTGKYETGLTEKEAKEYGIALGVDLSDTYTHEQAHPYFSLKPAWMALPNHTLLLDSSKPAEFVKIKNMKASGKIANSMKEWQEGLYPEATHVIFDEEQEVTEKASRIQLRQKATFLLPKMSTDDKANIILVLSNKSLKFGGLKNLKGRSTDFIDVEIAEIIDNDPLEFMRVANMGREEVSLRAKVLELVTRNVLTKEAGSYYYMGEVLGMDYESTVDWFRDPQNSKMKVLILEKLQTKEFA